MARPGCRRTTRRETSPIVTIPAPAWAECTVLLPLLGAAVALLAGARAAPRIGLLVSLGIVVCATGLALDLDAQGATRQPIGGWGAPLGIDLVVDGLSGVMI